MKDEFPSGLPQEIKQRPGPSFAFTLAALVICGAGSLSLYHWARDLHRFIQGISGYTALFLAQFAIYLLAVFFATRKPQPSTRRNEWLLAALVLVFAAAFRFDLVAERPYLSTDVYRYLWDGKVQAAGINPYRYVPAAPELASLRDEHIYPNINRRESSPTPYPPGAQMIFLGAYALKPSSVTAFKSLMSVFDLLSILAVMVVMSGVGLQPARALIFAWHPLLVYEGAHTGHIESGFIVFLALALLAWHYKAPTLVGVSLALATLIKYYPAMLLPAFLIAQGAAADEQNEPFLERFKKTFRPANLKSLMNAANVKLVIGFVVTVVLVHVPYLLVGEDAAGSLEKEFNEEGFTGSGERYFLVVLLRQLVPVPTNLFLSVAVLALFSLCLWWLLQQKRTAADVARASAMLIGLYFFLTTPRYPWYYAWILPFLCFAPRLAWLYLTGATVLLYALWFTPLVYPEIPIWMGLAVFAPTLVFLLLERRRQSKRSVPAKEAEVPRSTIKSIS